MPKLTELSAQLVQQTQRLDQLRAEYRREEAQLMADIVKTKNAIGATSIGLDTDTIAKGREVLAIQGSYLKGGEDRKSVVADALQWLATGKVERINTFGVRYVMHGLEAATYGTKDYDRWHGQRSDHAYHMGPRHGSIVFQVGLREPKRVLTDDEREAAIYLLLNLERIESVKDDAA